MGTGRKGGREGGRERERGGGQRDPFRTVSYLDHSLDLGFAITYHKIQVLAQRILLFFCVYLIPIFSSEFILRDELFSTSSWT